MGSVDIVLPSRDSARIANLLIDAAKINTFSVLRKCFDDFFYAVVTM